MGYLDGFGVTLRKWVGVQTDTGRRVTTEYPEEVRPKPERFHGRHVLNKYEDGMEKCIGCELCAGVCPAQCIYVRGQDNDPENPTSPGERFGYVYEINYLRCIHCDLCVEACPTEAITETKMFEFAFTNRADAIYTKDELLVADDGRPQRLPWENWDGGFDAAEDTSGWMRATASSGDADFVGLVAWAGELGYGVRPAEGALPGSGSDADTPSAPEDPDAPLHGHFDVDEVDRAEHRADAVHVEDDVDEVADGPVEQAPLRGAFDHDGPTPRRAAEPLAPPQEDDASVIARLQGTDEPDADAAPADEATAQQAPAGASPVDRTPAEEPDAASPDEDTEAADDDTEAGRAAPQMRGVFDAPAAADDPEPKKPGRGWRRGRGDRR